MLLRIIAAVSLACSGVLALSQEIDINELPRPEFGGLNHKQVTRRIFEQENAMIDKLATLHPFTESYMQSLGPRRKEKTGPAFEEQSEGVIDDLYFFGRTDFSDNGIGEVLLFGGGPWRETYIKDNSDLLAEVHPLGMVWMFFVDLNEFDADTYALTYEGKQTLMNTECLVFAVAPVRQRAWGRFHGDIWVDSLSFGIVRAKGAFTSAHGWSRLLHGRARFFHFDTWREKTENGLWVPNSSNFEERKTSGFNAGNVEYHYRGYSHFWRQPRQAAHGNEAEDISTKSSVAPGSLDSSESLISQLESTGLLASLGPEERRLNQIVQQIAPTNVANAPTINCRILLTTPVDIFSLGNTIIVSRGLLNLAPSDSVLAFMLARQVAYVLLGNTANIPALSTETLFNVSGKHEFPGLGIRVRPEDEAAADSKATLLIQQSPYKGTDADARSFLSQLKSESNRFPNLIRARFGASIISSNQGAQVKVDGRYVRGSELRFINRYGISWNREIVDSQQDKSQTEIGVLKPLAVQTPVLK